MERSDCGFQLSIYSYQCLIRAAQVLQFVASPLRADLLFQGSQLDLIIYRCVQKALRCFLLRSIHNYHCSFSDAPRTPQFAPASAHDAPVEPKYPMLETHLPATKQRGISPAELPQGLLFTFSKSSHMLKMCRVYM